MNSGIERAAAFLDKTAEINKLARPRFPRVWLDDATPALDGSYLIKGLIDQSALTLIYGPSGDGKTFFTADLAGHIAAGMQWRGHRVHSGLVVYVAAEAGASILNRFFAWRDNHVGDAYEGRIPLAIITKGIDLLKMGDMAALIEELRVIAAEAGLPLALVVFDTLSRSMPGGDENSPADMTGAVGAADSIRDELGAGVVFVHHTGKNEAKGARGHSSLLAAADTVIAVIDRTATVEKSRDSVSGASYPFVLDVVELGEDEDGDKITTCVVRHTDEQKRGKKPKKLAPATTVALRALKEAISDRGRVMPETSTIPAGVRAVTIDDWRTQFKVRYGDREDAAVKKAFNRGKTILLEDHVGISGDYAWVW